MLIRRLPFSALILAMLIAGSIACVRTSKHDNDNSLAPNNPTPAPTQKNNDKSPQVNNTESPEKIGRLLGIAKDTSTGKLSFGVVYTLASDANGMSWLVTFRTDITDAELAKLPDTIYWNMIHKSGDSNSIVPPQESRSLPKSALKTGQIKLNETQAIIANAILMQQDGMLAFGPSPQDTALNPQFKIDIGDVCHKNPEYFSNLTSNLRCFEITNADVGL